MTSKVFSPMSIYQCNPNHKFLAAHAVQCKVGSHLTPKRVLFQKQETQYKKHQDEIFILQLRHLINNGKTQFLKVSALILTYILETLDVSDTFLLKKRCKAGIQVCFRDQSSAAPGAALREPKVICPTEQNSLQGTTAAAVCHVTAAYTSSLPAGYEQHQPNQ